MNENPLMGVFYPPSLSYLKQTGFTRCDETWRALTGSKEMERIAPSGTDRLRSIS